MPNQYRPWTPGEEKKLRQLYPKTRTDELAKILRRSCHSINQRAFQLKIKANKAYHRIANPENIYKQLTEAERGYIAGLIDGEGTVALYNHDTKYTSTKTYNYRLPRVAIGNTNMEVITWLGKKLGGSTKEVKRNKKRENEQNFWIWTLASGYRIRQLLQVILPYLIIKREQALRVLNYPTTFAPEPQYIPEEYLEKTI